MKRYGEIDGVPIEFTNHALKRMVEMEMTADEIKKIILEPEDIFSSRKFPDDVCHRRGEYTMAFCRDNGRYVVKTVLYATKAAWIKANRDGKLKDDRVLRLDTSIPNF